MADEHVFLNENNIYVSNTKVILHGTTYATANITSVAKRMTPASTGCATLLIVAGALAVLGTVVSFASSPATGDLPSILMAAGVLIAGIVWLRSLKPTYHVFLASASAERQGLSSQDDALVSRVTTAITDAITHRG